MVGHILQYHPVLHGDARARPRGADRTAAIARFDAPRSRRIRREEDALWALAPHDISLILALAGAARRASSRRAATTPTRPSPTTPTWRWISRAASGPRSGSPGSIPSRNSGSSRSARPARSCSMIASPGSGSSSSSRSRSAVRPIAPTSEKGEPEWIAVPQGEPLKEECRHFLSRRSAPAKSPGRTGARGSTSYGSSRRRAAR